MSSLPALLSMLILPHFSLPHAMPNYLLGEAVYSLRALDDWEMLGLSMYCDSVQRGGGGFTGVDSLQSGASRGKKFHSQKEGKTIGLQAEKAAYEEQSGLGFTNCRS